MTAVLRLFEFDALDFLERLITGNNDLFAGLQAVEDFDMFGIASAEANVSAGRVAPVGRAPELVKFEGQFYAGGPVWRIEMSTPQISAREP